MQKIAIISDIHGNLPALRAVIQDIKTVFQADHIYCLGDLTDGAPWHNEVIDTIRELQIPTIMGNHDERIAFNYEVFPLQKHSLEEQKARLKTITHTKNTITDINKEFLSKLPESISLKYLNACILLVHGSPNNNDEYIYENCDDNFLRNLFEQMNANIIVTGHTHLSYIRHVKTNKVGQNNLFINAGSVGRSKEINGGKAVYLWLTIDDLQNKAHPVLRKIDYNISETISGIRNSYIPDFYANFLSETIKANK
ncbi:MAG: metallophosphoesterase family protein [Paludibacter sp.]|nr:metallophosphoesterase family protein [Paludibacter sp.]